MKKLFSVLSAAVLSLSVLAVTASADGMVLLDPYPGDIITNNPTYITDVKDSNGIVTGRVIDASTITASTTLASAEQDETKENTYLRYRNYAHNDSGYGFDGGTARFKNNFVWEFDFNFESLPSTDGDGGCFFIQLGGNWQNAVKFIKYADAQTYYIQWGSHTDTNGKYISMLESSNNWKASGFALEPGKTYHLKFEADVRKDKLHVTFTNPYVQMNSDGSFNKKLTEPAGEGVQIFTKTTTGTSALGATQTTALDDIKTGWKRVNGKITAKSAAKLTLSNEKFYIDSFYSMPPEISVEGNKVTATGNAINITNFKHNATMPSLVLAVYKDNELVAYSENSPYAEGTNTLTDYNYSTVIENLPDGTYTLKAFVWNNLDKMQPCENCLVEKTLTVSGGAAALE